MHALESQSEWKTVATLGLELTCKQFAIEPIKNISCSRELNLILPSSYTATEMAAQTSAYKAIVGTSDQPDRHNSQHSDQFIDQAKVQYGSLHRQGHKLDIPTFAILAYLDYCPVLRQLARHKRHAPRQPPIHRPRLRIHITRFVTRQKQHGPRNLIRLPASPQRIQLPNFPLTPPLPRRIVRNLGHARLNQPWTNRITPNPRAHQLVRTRLHQTNHRGFGRRVVRRPGVGLQPGHRGGRDNRSRRIRLRSGCLQHRATRVLGGEEYR
jgi:hypothetical protein